MGPVEPVVQGLLDALVADNPVLATLIGLTDGLDRLPSWSAGAVAGRLRLLRDHEARLLPFLAADDTAVAVDAFAGLQVVHRILREVEARDGWRRRPNLYLEVLYGLLPILMRELAPADVRIAALDGRLRATPGLLEEARDNLEPGLPRDYALAGLDLAEGLLDLVGPTVRGFAAGLGRERALDGASAAATTAVEAFRDHLRDALLPTAVPECGAGAAVVDDLLRWELVIDDEPDELAAYGREVLAATRDEMAAVAAELGHDTVAAAVAAEQARHPDRDGLVAAYVAAVDEARAFLVAHDIATLPAGEELEVMATPTFLRSLVPFAAYDPPGPFSPRKLGFYFLTPPRDGLNGPALEDALRMHPLASLPGVAVHEAYPGHHLQLVRANSAPTLARRIAWLPMGGAILIEGWAFYCEELMDRQGLLAQPALRLMRLNDQAWRACRVTIDVELHLGTMGLAEAIDFLSAEAHMPRAEAELECRRYAEEPGQAMSYLLGKREIVKLAAMYRGQHPGDSLREFHDALLDWGSIPPAAIAWGMGLGTRPAAARPSS